MNFGSGVVRTPVDNGKCLINALIVHVDLGD